MHGYTKYLIPNIVMKLTKCMKLILDTHYIKIVKFIYIQKYRYIRREASERHREASERVSVSQIYVNHNKYCESKTN